MKFFVTKDERNNIIYHYKPLDEIKQETNINFYGKNNIIFLCEKAFLQKSKIYISGDENLLFIANTNFCMDINIFGFSLCYVGNNNFLNPFRKPSRAELSEHKALIIGDNNLISWECEFENFDWHFIYDKTSKKRINEAKNIHIGDFCWISQNAKFLKGGFVASGSIIGARSVTSGKVYYSNSIYAGVSAKKIKTNVFWHSSCPISWDKKAIQAYNFYDKEECCFTFQKEKFLNPALIEKELESMDTALQKLEFVYDYIYNNTEKNRFALFEDSDISECKLYKDESKTAFKDLEFIDSKELQKLEIFKPKGAKERIQNTLSYKLGLAMIQNSKNTSGIIRLPFTLLKIQNKHNKAQKLYQEQIKINPNLKLPPLQTYEDYHEALKAKEHLSYKLGEALIQAHKNILKGGYVKFFFELKRIKNTHCK
ncbi:hypothetical protein DMB95_09190, partial [Campylobacter sp. MIT 12-8780]